MRAIVTTMKPRKTNVKEWGEGRDDDGGGLRRPRLAQIGRERR